MTHTPGRWPHDPISAFEGPREPPRRIRLLRGQVVIREDLRADTGEYTHLIIPDRFSPHNPDHAQESRTWHRGTVLAMGAPMLTKRGVEVPHGFAVGDEVIFHWAHHEKSWTREWVDGLPACWIPQAYVDAVVNEAFSVIIGQEPCRACGEPTWMHHAPRGAINTRCYCPSEVHEFGERKT